MWLALSPFRTFDMFSNLLDLSEYFKVSRKFLYYALDHSTHLLHHTRYPETIPRSYVRLLELFSHLSSYPTVVFLYVIKPLSVWPLWSETRWTCIRTLHPITDSGIWIPIMAHTRRTNRVNLIISFTYAFTSRYFTQTERWDFIVIP